MGPPGGTIQERYAVFGARELVVFDPLLVGPRALGGPLLLQIWRRNELGSFERCYAGAGPAFCETLGAWLLPTDRLLQIADDRSGTQRWLNGEERARAELAGERAARFDLERQLASLKKAGGQ